ncbi:MAG: hypothetical protein D6718_05430 [Acidobacteria bacterium]|nr:MAG: hypothetical protein D6718_05430 [Acidobacteriota bacterium]
MLGTDSLTGLHAIRSRRDVGPLVEAVRELASRMGFGSAPAALIATATSELATNIVRYGGGGEVALRRVWEPGRRGLAVVARDRGPGIADVEAALRPGYSTGGGLGLGLPAVVRIMDDVAIATSPDAGTRVVALRWCHRSASADEQPCGIALKPLQDDSRCGDTAIVVEEGERWGVAIVDVLGHGREAHRLARRLLRRLRGEDWSDPAALLDRLHVHVRGSRGAAAGVSLVDAARGRVRHAGVGNTVTAVVGTSVQRLTGRSGVLGGTMPRARAFEAPVAAGDALVCWTDGLADRAVRKALPELGAGPAPVLAAQLLERCARGTDDAACVALRISG